MTYLSSPKLPSVCADSDLREVVDHIHSTYCKHGRKLYALGFSIGGNALCKLAGLDGPNCKLDAIYVCQSPLIFAETSKNMRRYGCGIVDYLGGVRSYA